MKIKNIMLQKIILAKNIEIYNKIENSYLSIEEIHQKIIKLKRKIFIWIDIMPEKFNEKLKRLSIKQYNLCNKTIGKSGI